MKKYLWILFFLILIIGIAAWGFYNNSKEDTYTAEKTSIQNNKNQYEEEGIKEDLKIESFQNSENQEIIAEFTTKLPKDTKARYSNIELACKTLNDTIVKQGEIFSLWNVLGCPTKEKGYKKAKAFTANGEVRQSYGGGICQVSTTIYNAVLEVEGLKVKERHEHSRDVVYIKDGKDAAVSYKSADLKFQNTLNYDIKIESHVENKKVKISLVRI